MLSLVPMLSENDFHMTAGPKVPTHRLFFKPATQKGNDILLPKRQKKKKKIGGHRLRFGENMP